MNKNARKSRKKFKETRPEEYAIKRKLEDEKARERQTLEEEQLRLKYKSVREQFKTKLVSMKSFTAEEAWPVSIEVFPYFREQAMLYRRIGFPKDRSSRSRPKSDERIMTEDPIAAL